jgi:hypothetical protein
MLKIANEMLSEVLDMSNSGISLWRRGHDVACVRWLGGAVVMMLDVMTAFYAFPYSSEDAYTNTS